LERYVGTRRGQLVEEHYVIKKRSACVGTQRETLRVRAEKTELEESHGYRAPNMEQPFDGTIESSEDATERSVQHDIGPKGGKNAEVSAGEPIDNRLRGRGEESGETVGDEFVVVHKVQFHGTG